MVHKFIKMSSYTLADPLRSPFMWYLVTLSRIPPHTRVLYVLFEWPHSTSYIIKSIKSKKIWFQNLTDWIWHVSAVLSKVISSFSCMEKLVKTEFLFDLCVQKEGFLICFFNLPSRHLHSIMQLMLMIDENCFIA